MALLRGEKSLVDDLLDRIRRIRDQHRQVLALGTTEGVKHPIGGVLPARRPTDPDAHPDEVRRRQRLRHVAHAVVAAVAAAGLELEGVERDVELVVDDGAIP